MKPPLTVPNLVMSKPAPSKPRFSHLRDLHILFSLMFTSRLYSQTILMLNSPSVTSLVISACLSLESWTRVTHFTNLPSLTKLGFHCESPLSFDDLMLFLARHRNITEISFQDNIPSVPWNPCASSFCRVTTIISPPGFISNVIRNCGALHPLLRITVEVNSASPETFYALDNDFEALSMVEDCNIHLTLRLLRWSGSSDDLEWLKYSSATGSSVEYQRPERLVTCIKTIDIKFCIFYKCIPIQETAKWLKLFPCLEQVQVSIAFMAWNPTEDVRAAQEATRDRMREALQVLGVEVAIVVT